jgi:hypothetical protein
VSWQEFWGTVPRLVPLALRQNGLVQHCIPIRFQPTTPPAPDPYAGVRAGKKPRTDIENELDHVQACFVADLQALLAALAKAMAHRDAKKHRRETPPTLDDVLNAVFPGPSSTATLLRKGNIYTRDRDANWDTDYRGYLTAEKADRFSSVGNIEALRALVAAHVTAITLIGRARNAAQATAEGFRATLMETAKGKRRDDETIARDMLDHLPDLSIIEMVTFSFVSGINASHIWHCYHGAPYTIDYYRLFNLAVFAGRLARGEPALITWDLSRYVVAHRRQPNIKRWWRVLLFPNTVPVHYAIEDLLTRIDDSYGLAKFLGGLILCDQPGESRTFRRPPLSA